MKPTEQIKNLVQQILDGIRDGTWEVYGVHCHGGAPNRSVGQRWTDPADVADQVPLPQTAGELVADTDVSPCMESPMQDAALNVACYIEGRLGEFCDGDTPLRSIEDVIVYVEPLTHDV